MREMIEAREASLQFLPAYSPDLNPIEQAFAKLKALLRRAQPRTRQRLCDAIASALSRFKPDESRNDLANSGYGQAK